MVSQFEHLKLPRIINIELPRRSHGGGGGGKRADFIEHGKHLLDQLSGLTERTKQKSNPFRLDPKLIFKIKVTKKLSDDLVNQTGLDILAFEPDKAIVVFSSDLELKEFRRRLENYSHITEGHEYSYLGAIDELVPLEREDRIGRLLELKPVQLGELAALDLELWHTGDRQEMKVSLEHIAETIEYFSSDTAPMRMSDSYVGEYLCIARIKVTHEVLEFLLELETVKEIDRPPQPAFERTADYNLPISRIPEVISPPEDNCGILVIDSGVQRGHPLIARVLGEADVFPDPAQQLIRGGADDVHGHGTNVAGIAIYGDVENCIKKLSFDPTVWLFSARVTDENCEYYEDLLVETQLDQAIRAFVDQYPNCKVINISLGNAKQIYRDGMKQFRLAAKIDEIAYQYQNQNKNIIFVISAGNSYHEELGYEQLRTEYPNYLLNKKARIIDPATSAIALTVGSLSYGRGSMTEPGDVRRQAIAKLRGYPSPFTRTGFGVDGMIKPDVVDFGGDLALDLSYREALGLPKVSQLEDNVAGISVVTFSKNFQSSLFNICSGTSFAAPRVANIAAQLFTKYPNASSNLIRALIVNSAVLPKEIPDEFSKGTESKKIKKQLQIYGYGQTDLERAMYSAENYVVLSEDNIFIPVGKFHIYEIPQLPEEFFDIEGTRTLSVTLAFDPPTRPTRGDSYLGVTMEFNIFKGIDKESVVNAYVDASRTDKPGEFAEIPIKNLKKKYPKRSITIDLSPGSNLRKKGTVQRGQTQLKSGAKKYNNLPMTLVVSCNRKWANPDEIEIQRYALVVSVSHSDPQVNLYNRLKLKVDEIDLRERSRARI
ncbi:Peptidase S8 and S53, subtilisin, kexin, sedolisin [Trichormus variabilis ATCC 29413]|uniref:Peptidase S8 and S53, subtilisin, kexin, sedolisin n=2 Tax=Anabaena variabilis TaxID=264691 RepID=Q3M7C5_TRIV2|nr:MULTISPECIES: S8 family peptidase [Nostocaceae]ABA23111.1 Peptidase S8 and S53, subtilisin, kexin, sedolisin [Trichormus variabilis ATCC 29413]MBC1214097.1 S8 family peptidase [Trichormus variabilis ARAD]MBC1256458.1 S8 family peptidase [Trichormus variabilis V5]MBC1268525.1 S8 family peptidase [Trichormus variabilis FSR]MBC1303358.1 S8 family peptidase [Trichormus variabilis N2B]